jgi:cyanuric acid amidohydrolase
MSAALRQQVGVWRVSCSGPADLSGVQALVDAGKLVPAEIVAVMGKTEGNGCVNDHTREFASMAWAHFLAGPLDCRPDQVGERVALVMSGGTEGVLSPHFTVFTRKWLPDDGRAGDKRLVLGIAHTADFAPEEIGQLAQVQATAAAVQSAMLDAGIRQSADVHFVQIKCPLLTAGKVNDALARGAATVTRDSYESMGWSRGASALGVAVALGEVTLEDVRQAGVLGDSELYSARASASAGIELDNNVVIVLGEAMGSASSFRIGHSVMRDAVDAGSVRRLLRNAFGLDVDLDPGAVAGRLVNLLAKAEASPSGTVRGARHTMLDDSDINATRHARAAVGAVLASVAGQTALYVSGGAEHQGPPGGGPVAAIVRMEPSA